MRPHGPALLCSLISIWSPSQAVRSKALPLDACVTLHAVGSCCLMRFTSTRPCVVAITPYQNGLRCERTGGSRLHCAGNRAPEVGQQKISRKRPAPVLDRGFNPCRNNQVRPVYRRRPRRTRVWSEGLLVPLCRGHAVEGVQRAVSCMQCRDQEAMPMCARGLTGTGSKRRMQESPAPGRNAVHLSGAALRSTGYRVLEIFTVLGLPGLGR